MHTHMYIYIYIYIYIYVWKKSLRATFLPFGWVRFSVQSDFFLELNLLLYTIVVSGFRMCVRPCPPKHSCRRKVFWACSLVPWLGIAGSPMAAASLKCNYLLIWTFTSMIGLAGIGTSLPFFLANNMVLGFLLNPIMFVFENRGLSYSRRD